MDKNSDSGNILFLILIAVALFGSLSYAVTVSLRAGGEDSAYETDRLANSSLMQYSVGVRGSVMRMVIGGENIQTLEFNAPDDFANCSAGFDRCVFHPQGGSATYSISTDSDIMASGAPGQWIFNGENEINGLSTTTAGDASSAQTSDLIAFMPGISQRFCASVNEQNDIQTIPVEIGIIFTSASQMENPDGVTNTSMPGTGATIGSPTGTDVALLDGLVSGCFEQGGVYVYYHALLER